MSEFDVEKITKELMDIACTFQGKAKACRQASREKYKKEESDACFAIRISIDGLIAKLALLMEEKIENVTESDSFQISVSASCVRTHFVVNDLILEGDLIEAFVLLRKQLEALARLNELDSKPLSKLLKNTPNVKNALKGGGGSVYGMLSEIAHSSSHRIHQIINIITNEEKIGPYIFPNYNENSFAAFDLSVFINLLYLHWMIEKMEKWYGRKLDVEKESLARIFILSKTHNIIKIAQ